MKQELITLKKESEQEEVKQYEVKIQIKPVSGPRGKKDSSKILEGIIYKLLDEEESKQIKCYFENKDLMISIGDSIYNLSLILEDNPDFDHIVVHNKESKIDYTEKYAEFLKQAQNKPRIQGKFPTPEGLSKA